jgi:hypothetical protein
LKLVFCVLEYNVELYMIVKVFYLWRPRLRFGYAYLFVTPQTALWVCVLWRPGDPGVRSWRPRLCFGCAYYFVTPQTALWVCVLCMTPQTALWVCVLCDAPDCALGVRIGKTPQTALWVCVDTFWEGYIDLYGRIYISVEESFGMAWSQIIPLRKVFLSGCHLWHVSALCAERIWAFVLDSN